MRRWAWCSSLDAASRGGGIITRRAVAPAKRPHVAPGEGPAQTGSCAKPTCATPRRGALNRSAFLQRFDETIAREARIGKRARVLLVDIEGFKAINIERGRIGGDAR
jgi:hypothetical protein